MQQQVSVNRVGRDGFRAVSASGLWHHRGQKFRRNIALQEAVAVFGEHSATQTDASIDSPISQWKSRL